MTITPAQFKARFPEFDTVDDARIQIFIDEAVCVLNESYWGECKYDLGLYYYTAHLLFLADSASSGGGGGVSGSVTGRAVDGTSISYGSPSGDVSQSDAWLSSTFYGQRYLALRNSLGIPAFSVC